MGWRSVPQFRIPNIQWKPPDLTAQVLKKRDCPSVGPASISKTGTLIFYLKDRACLVIELFIFLVLYKEFVDTDIAGV